jgi:hypothetical protein
MAWWALLVLGLALTGANAQSGIPPSTEFPFETTRQPFLPRLLVSRDEPLCNDFLSALRKDFLAQHRGQDSLFKEPPMTIGHWMVWPSARDLGGGAGVDFAEVDLDQDGKKQLLLHAMKPFNWRGNYYDLLIRSKATTDGLESEIAELEKLPPLGRQTGSLKIVASADLPRLWRWGIYNGSESPLKVLLYRDAAYLYTFADGIMVGWVRPGTATLQRIHAEGSLDIQCQASVIPRPGALPHPSWYGLPRQPDTLAAPLEVIDWMRTIRAMQGSEGQMAGTLHALDYLIIRSTYVWYDALVRPWDVVAAPYYPPPQFMRAWIHQWGFGSLSQFRLARAFETGRQAAIDALGRYYEDAFGVPNGKEAASLITDRVISASFVVHVGNPPSDEELQRQIADTGSESTHLRTALLIGSPPDKLRALIKEDGLEGQVESGVDSPEPALFYALEHPDEVRLLLDSGADIDEGNSFGKTALMYAAHYDLADTVTLLLARGADISKRTTTSTAMNTNIAFGQRTALMYAAENASVGMIRALIQAGADTCAIDSGNRDVANYLSRNRRLSDAERTEIAALIAADQPCER